MPRKLSVGPSWLNYSHSLKKHEYDAEKAKIVNRIFEESAKGIGAYVIANRLNEDGVPTIGRASLWLRSSITKILKNRAVLGEFQKTTRIVNRDVAEGDPVAGYYPSIISVELFDAAQEAARLNAKSGRGRKGYDFSNLFSGLIVCAHCESKIKLDNNGAGRRSFICRNYSRSKICVSTRWDYETFERRFAVEVVRMDLTSTSSNIKILNEIFSTDVDQLDRYAVRANRNQTLKTIVDRILLISSDKLTCDHIAKLNHVEGQAICIDFIDHDSIVIRW